MDRLFENDYILEKEKAKLLNPTALAFVGDAVYTLYIRGLVVKTHDVLSGKLHLIATNYVKAQGQSDAIEKLLPQLSEEEMYIYKRARNYETKSVAKHANIIDYKRATGLEALIGYLYLTNQVDRLNEILKICTEQKC